jgi:hypothetical protein
MSTARRAHPPLQNGAGGDDGDDERDEEDGDEELEEEEEPRLKYQRLGGSVPAILSTDAAASIAVADRMVALGTHNGTLHILDFQGNQVPLATGRSPFGILDSWWAEWRRSGVERTGTVALGPLSKLPPYLLGQNFSPVQC